MSEARIEAINKTLLDGYQAYQTKLGAAKKTMKAHRGSLEFFSDYLLEDEHTLSDATHADVSHFMNNWFPDKAMWACKTEVNIYCAVFKKFYRWLAQTHDYSAENVDDIVATIKEEKEFWQDAVALDDDW